MKSVAALLLSSAGALVALSTTSLSIALVDARPMHAGINYERYLAESDKINGELDEWMKTYGKDAEANGWLPATESRSADEIQEDRKQRFFMAKELVGKLKEQNPDAEFSTASPFTLMTEDEFAKYIGNSFLSSATGRRLRAEGQPPSGDNSPNQRSPSSNNNQQPGNGNKSNGGNHWFSFDSFFDYMRKKNGETGSESDPSSVHGYSFQDFIDWFNKNNGGGGDTPNQRPTDRPNNRPDQRPTNGPRPSRQPSPQPQPTRTRTPQPQPTPGPAPGPAPGPGPRPNPVGPVAPTGTPAPGPKPSPDDDFGGDSNSKDWSKHKCMAPIQNQGQCGSCWAFATVAAVETGQCLKSGNLVKYSEQHVTGCDRNGSNGCNGGIPTYALQFIQKGVCTADSAPYKASNQCVSCSPVQTGMTGQQPVQGDSGLVSALGTSPVVMAVAAGNNAWKQYRGGVLSGCDTNNLDHAVVAVGFDATSIKIRNSWGTGWGENGYIRIKRSNDRSGACGMYQNLIRPTF